MKIRHNNNCKRLFKQYDTTCARCRELKAGAAPRPVWHGYLADEGAARIRELRRLGV